MRVPVRVLCQRAGSTRVACRCRCSRPRSCTAAPGPFRSVFKWETASKRQYQDYKLLENKYDTVVEEYKVRTRGLLFRGSLGMRSCTTCARLPAVKWLPVTTLNTTHHRRSYVHGAKTADSDGHLAFSAWNIISFHSLSEFLD